MVDPEVPAVPPTPRTPANGAPPVVRTVPQERYNATVAEKKELAARVATLEAEVQSVTERAATADTLAKQLEELRASTKAQAAAWEEKFSLQGAGLTDPEDVDVARTLYGRMPAEGKPKTIADAVTAWRADPTTAPRALAHVFGPATVPAAGAAGAAGKPVTPAPNATGAPGTRPAAGEPVTGAALKALRESAQASGDWTAFNAASKAAEVERRAARGAR